HYYGIDEPFAYAEWLSENDVTIWLKTDYRGEPVLEVVQTCYPGLFEPLYEVSYTMIFRVDQATLESILGEGNS
ncbi:hypothetical protein KAT55_00830, partial [Candidatus Bathyarchaeota archaeon]|nr:hypothetical protein [Candidatus Bathyarchaeota archaeon]